MFRLNDYPIRMLDWLAPLTPIVQLHRGGTLGYQNHDGPGCTFTITVPLQDA